MAKKKPVERKRDVRKSRINQSTGELEYYTVVETYIEYVPDYSSDASSTSSYDYGGSSDYGSSY